MGNGIQICHMGCFPTLYVPRYMTEKSSASSNCNKRMGQWVIRLGWLETALPRHQVDSPAAQG